jgi:hypothetical protein
MPLDAPPPIGPPPGLPPGGPPPPSAGGLPSDAPQMDALSGMAGMGMGGMDGVSLVRMAAEWLSKAAQFFQAQGDMASAAQLAQALSQVTSVGQSQLQGQMAGAMAGNGMGAPPPPGVSAASLPGMAAPASATPQMLPG